MSAETKHTPNNQQFNIRLPAELKARLETYAQLVGRPQASVASEALADYLDWRIPQIEALKKAVASADHGDFATREEVEQFFKRYEA
ncbi:MAG: CopG family transcriptional regulator [Pseudomonadota bacterium]